MNKASGNLSQTRASGVLLHVTSLPSQLGIGDFGPAAERWLDWLVEAGQTWWQLLPLNPIDDENSPYRPVSTFALNPLLISPERLCSAGLLSAEDVQAGPPGADRVDFASVAQWKQGLLAKAWEAFSAGGGRAGLRPEFSAFCGREAYWLDDYTLFLALKQTYSGVHYLDWPPELVRREAEALEQARSSAGGLLERYAFEQFLARGQFDQLRAAAQARGILLLGDLPFFVSPDSADVWAHPQVFQLLDDGRPLAVAGVPPDYFSDDGQLWGNPLYNWTALRKTEYRWWIDRLRWQLELFDAVRLDHFRAFEAAWHVPTGAETAQHGEWLPGPGADFFQCLREALGGLPFVAEDLGLITDEVRALRDQFELPRMAVLQFAFDGDPQNAFLPQNVVQNSVIYTATHDNNTTRGWYERLAAPERARVASALQLDSLAADQVAWQLLETAWHTCAALAVAPLQDVLNLGGEARMNLPGTSRGNWQWRCPPESLTAELAARLRQLTEAVDR